MEQQFYSRLYAPASTHEFFNQWVHYCFAPTVKTKGRSESCQVSFFDKNLKRLYTLPFFIMPINTNGRASQLLINQICKSDPRIESVLFSSAAIGEEHGNVIASHLESRSLPKTTFNFVHEIKDFKLHPCEEDKGSVIVAELPLVFYGFFEEPEVNISKLKWDRINKKIAKVIKCVESQDKKSINEVYDLLTSIYDSLVKMVKDLPDQPKLEKMHEVG